MCKFIPIHCFVLQDTALTRRVERLCDTVVKLESFVGSENETNPVYKDYHGKCVHFITSHQGPSDTPFLPTGRLSKMFATHLFERREQQSVFTHVSSIYANLLEQKKAFTEEKSSTPTGLVWSTNVAAVTSCENALFPRCRNGIIVQPGGIAAASQC